MAKRNYSVDVVLKALDLLETLAGVGRELTLDNLAALVGLSRNRTARLLETLEEKGMVERESYGGFYRLGLTSVELAQRLLHSRSIPARGEGMAGC